MGLKDVDLALDAARSKNAVLPSAQILRDNIKEAIDQGLGSTDWSTLAKVTRRRASPPEGDAYAEQRLATFMGQSVHPSG